MKIQSFRYIYFAVVLLSLQLSLDLATFPTPLAAFDQKYDDRPRVFLKIW